MVVRNFLYESALFQRIDALDSLGIPGIPYRGGFAGEVAADLQEAATQDSFFYAATTLESGGGTEGTK